MANVSTLCLNHSICASVRQMINLSTQPCAVLQVKIVVSLGSDYTSATNGEITFFLNLSIFRPKSSFARNISYFRQNRLHFASLRLTTAVPTPSYLNFKSSWLWCLTWQPIGDTWWNLCALIGRATSSNSDNFWYQADLFEVYKWPDLCYRLPLRYNRSNVNCQLAKKKIFTAEPHIGLRQRNYTSTRTIWSTNRSVHLQTSVKLKTAPNHDLVYRDDHNCLMTVDRHMAFTVTICLLLTRNALAVSFFNS